MGFQRNPPAPTPSPLERMNALSLLLVVLACSCNALLLAPAAKSVVARTCTSSIEMFAPSKKAGAKKVVAKKPVKKVVAKKPAKKVVAKKPVKKAPAKKVVAKELVKKAPAGEPSFLTELFSLSFVGGGSQSGTFP